MDRNFYEKEIKNVINNKNMSKEEKLAKHNKISNINNIEKRYQKKIEELEFVNQQLSKQLGLTQINESPINKRASLAVDSLEKLSIERLKGINTLNKLRDMNKEQYHNIELDHILIDDAKSAKQNLFLKEKGYIMKKDLEKKEKVSEMKHVILSKEDTGELKQVNLSEYAYNTNKNLKSKRELQIGDDIKTVWDLTYEEENDKDEE